MTPSKTKPKRGSYKESKSIQRKKLTNFEKKWGEVCMYCGRRRGTFFATSGAEGGSNNICECGNIADEKGEC